MPWFVVPVELDIEVEAENEQEAKQLAQTLFDKRISECEWGHEQNDRASVRRGATIGKPELEDMGDDDDDGAPHPPSGPSMSNVFKKS